MFSHSLRVKVILCLVPICLILLSYKNEVRAISLKRMTRAIQMYTTKYDNIDVDSILASTRLLKNYINCLLDKGSCSAEGKVLKNYLPDAIATECSKCSAAQKKIAGKLFAHLLLKHRDDWNKLTAKYDPDGNFQAKYIDEDEDYSDLEEA